MAEQLQNKIKESLRASEGLYYRLVLLVGAAGSGKTGILRDVAAEFGASVVNVNLTMSSELLELTAKQRSLQLPKILGQVVDKAETPVLLDNLEILFDKGLKQDPLRLLQGISRNRPVVASWNGTVTDGMLFYAEPDHPEYRRYDSVDALIVDTNQTSMAASTQGNS